MSDGESHIPVPDRVVTVETHCLKGIVWHIVDCVQQTQRWQVFKFDPDWCQSLGEYGSKNAAMKVYKEKVDV